VDGSIIDLVNNAMSSPWIYLALFLLAALDSFLPLVPSETAVITAGVFAATGKPQVLLVIAVAAVGAFAGDHVSYLVGRYAGGRWGRRRQARREARAPRRAVSRAGGRRHAAVDWATRALGRRGGLVLIVARYIPGGRTAVTLATGAAGYPLRLFSSFDAIGALTWAIYCTMIGYLGGQAFQDNPIRGLLLGLGVALTITVLVEVVSRLVRRYRRRGVEPGAAAADRQPAATGGRRVAAADGDRGRRR
jgi:membrane-associated protein